MNLIIVEGPDGAGKTTLIDSWDPCTRIHHGAYVGKTEIALYYLASLVKARPLIARGERVVFDRSWLAEPIYGAAFRDGQDRIGRAQARMLERCALTLDAQVVMCLPPYPVCHRAWASRRAIEYLTNDVALRAVWDGYAALLERMRSGEHALPVVEYDYTTMTAPTLDELRPSLQNVGPGYGRWAPTEVALLIGDRVNPRATVSTREWWPPFVSFGENGCSAWLAERLEEGGVSERRLYWINSTDHLGRAVDPSFVKELRPKVIVAMGKHASRWCIEANLEHYDVAHPQYHKRFRFNEPYPLIDLLRRKL